MKHKKWLLIIIPFIFCSTVYAVSDATLTVIGDVDTFVAGQDGFCGQRLHASAESRAKIILRGDEQVWFEAKSTFRLANNRAIVCHRERTFIPKAGTAYILRMNHITNQCGVELFRVVTDADPVKEKMIQPASQSCMLK
jgi:hypothetical protein